MQTWADIVAVEAGEYYTLGLKRDGTVVATGDNDYGQCDVSSWSDIIDVSASICSTVGLKKNGTVVITKRNDWGEANVNEWSGIRTDNSLI